MQSITHPMPVKIAMIAAMPPTTAPTTLVASQPSVSFCTRLEQLNPVHTHDTFVEFLVCTLIDFPHFAQITFLSPYVLLNIGGQTIMLL